MNNLPFEKINLLLELCNDLSLNQWILLKTYIDNNFEKIEILNKSYKQYADTLNSLKKGLLNLQN